LGIFFSCISVGQKALHIHPFIHNILIIYKLQTSNNTLLAFKRLYSILVIIKMPLLIIQTVRCKLFIKKNVFGQRLVCTATYIMQNMYIPNTSRILTKCKVWKISISQIISSLNPLMQTKLDEKKHRNIITSTLV